MSKGGFIARHYGGRALVLLLIAAAGLVVGVTFLFESQTESTSIANVGEAPFNFPTLGSTVEVRLECVSPWDRWTGAEGSFPANIFSPLSPGYAIYEQDEADVDEACNLAIAGHEHIATLISVPSLALGIIVAWKGHRAPTEHAVEGRAEEAADTDEENESDGPL